MPLPPPQEDQMGYGRYKVKTLYGRWIRHGEESLLKCIGRSIKQNVFLSTSLTLHRMKDVEMGNMIMNEN